MLLGNLHEELLAPLQLLEAFHELPLERRLMFGPELAIEHAEVSLFGVPSASPSSEAMSSWHLAPRYCLLLPRARPEFGVLESCDRLLEVTAPLLLLAVLLRSSIPWQLAGVNEHLCNHQVSNLWHNVTTIFSALSRN